MDVGWQQSWRAALLAQAGLVWGAADIDAEQWIESGKWSKPRAKSVQSTFDDTMRQNIAELQAKWARDGRVTIE